MSGQFHLMREQRFRPFFFTQFLGAFNDNIYKNSLMILIAFGSFGAAGGVGLTTSELTNLCAALFILPYFLFSATAGQIADKFEKSRIIRLIKIFEIGIGLLACWGFYRQDLPLLIGTLFLLGTHSSLFGPVKYAVLPQHLQEHELVGGNGLVEMGTFLAILVGTILAGELISIKETGPLLAGGVCLLTAIVGYLASRGIPLAPAADPKLRINWNPFSETWRNLGFARRNRTVFLSLLGNSWFWFYGATFLTQFPQFAKDVLGGSEQVVTLLLAVFAIGVAGGSLLCERLSGRRVEIGLVPFGSIGMTAFAVDIYFASRGLTPPAKAYDAVAFMLEPSHWRVMLDLLGIGMFGGFYIVPLYALIQTRSEKSHQSRIIAANNILNALFMVVSAGLAVALFKMGLTIPQLFLVTACLNGLVAIYIYTLVPEFLMRFLIWMLIHTVYRLHKEGVERIPDDGAALLVANHVCFVDALIIAAACPRPIRFVTDHRVYHMPIIHFIMRTGRAIPIAPAKEAPEILDAAYDEIAQALDQGDLVCVFPEGRLTSDGTVGEFRSGVARILQRTPVPVVPIALCGLWGSLFSRKEADAARRRPRGPWSKIGLKVGAMLPATTDPQGLRQVVAELRGDWA